MGWFYPPGRTASEAHPELSLDRTLLASEGVGLVHGLSFDPLGTASLHRL